MNIIVLNYKEEFITFLDIERVKLMEENNIGGIRTINVEYSLIDMDDEYDLGESTTSFEKEDEYINEDVNELFMMGNKIFISGDENISDCLYVINTQVTRDYFNENKVTFSAEEILVELNYSPFFSQNDLTTKNGFTVSSSNGEDNIKVNYNALNFFFGDYFNIGIIQDCLSAQLSKISPTGTMTKMELLRYIEEETCNVFMTRYEKDAKTNVIHRFLDFLNPNDSDKSWEVNFEYVPPTGDDDIQHLPQNVYFGLFDKENDLIEEYNASDLGIDVNTTTTSVKLRYVGTDLKITIGKNTYTVPPNTEEVAGTNESNVDISTVNTFFDFEDIIVPNHSVFKVYDKETEDVLFFHKLNPSCGDTHTQVLDLGYNIENIEYELNETDAFEAIAPVIKFEKNEDSNTNLTKNDIGTIITRFKNLSVKKGDTIPMIVQKVNDPIAATSAHMSTVNISNNYFSRPLKPNDQQDSYEYWKGTAYWKAPFTKNKGDLFIQQDGDPAIQYNNIRDKADIDNNYGASVSPKIGPLETTQEDVYAIYNEIANKLKEKKQPTINIKIDAANYKNGEYNNYQVYDKVYIKIPNRTGLITAIVSKTNKDFHNIGENTIEFTNFNIGTKAITKETILIGDNLNLKYPKKGTLKVKLQEEESDIVLNGQILNFTLYHIDDTVRKCLKRIMQKPLIKMEKLV